MTANPEDDSAAGSARVDWRAGRHLRRRLLFTVVRVVLVTVVLCAVYTVAPLDRSDSEAVLQMCLALLGYTAIVVWQIIAVARSSYPRLRAIEAVSVSLPLLIFLFAATYIVTQHSNADSFNQHMSRVDAVYFTVTVFATVGFGDIAAKSETARILVTIQMLADLLLIGVIAKVLFGAVQRRTQVLGTGAPRDAADTDRAKPG